MMSLARPTLAALALAALPTMHGTAAAADVGVVVGTGTVTPGVPATGCVSGTAVAFSGDAVTLGTGLPPGPYHVVFTGNSIACASVLSDAGAGNLSGDVAGPVTYTRTLGVITLTGSVTVASQQRTITAVCEVEPLNAAPISSYALECVVTL